MEIKHDVCLNAKDPNTYGEADYDQMHALGLELGLVAAGLNLAIDAREDAAKQSANAVELLINLVTAAIPGVADDAVGKALASVFNKAKDEVIAGIEQEGLDAYTDHLLATGTLDNDALINELYLQIFGRLHVTGEFHSGWESGLGTDWPEGGTARDTD